MSNNVYSYDNAIVTKITDGDTITLQIDVGFNIFTNVKIRLYGINAPEVKGEEKPKGLKSKAYLESIIPLQSKVKVTTHGIDKYGRWLGVIYKDGLNINSHMVETKHAIEYML